MAQSIGLLMVREGLLTRESLERALQRKEREGGSLALNLVLEGAVDEGRLSEFYRDRYQLPVAEEIQLQSVDDVTFSLIPLEIIYDSGIIPLFLPDEENLAVGLVDPTDRGLIAEATFFSGYNLHQHLITVSQMARHFARLAKQHWKIGAAEAEALARAAVDVPDSATEDLLEQADVLESRLEAALEADLDEIYHPNAPLEIAPEFAGENLTQTGSFLITDRAAEGVSRIHLQPPSEIESAEKPVIVDAAEFQRELGDADEYTAVSDDAVAEENPFLEVEITQQVALGIGLDESVDIEPQRILEGEADTDKGTVRVLGINLDQIARSGDFSSPYPVISTRVSQFGDRPKTAVPTMPSLQAIPKDVNVNCHLLTLLGEKLGVADLEVAEAVTQICQRALEVTERDRLGDAIVQGLAPFFKSVAVMTLNGPRGVLWRCMRDGKPANELIGKTAEIQEGGVLHRIATERKFYFGALPIDCAVRDVTQNKHLNRVFLAPIELRGKTILMLYLDPGSAEFRSPGSSIEKLLVDVSKGLERVILMRKRGRRK